MTMTQEEAEETAEALAQRELATPEAAARAGAPAPFGTEVYLDNAATTKPRPEVVEAMREALEQDYGNASSLHAYGRRAKKMLEESRATLAEALGVAPCEVYFTSGGTESNNLAVRGVCDALAREQKVTQIVTSALEHPSVTRSIRSCKREGWQVRYVEAVGGDFELDGLRAYLSDPTALISVMTVQNELGYRFPVEAVARARDELAPGALVHTDAVQAFGKLPVSPGRWGVDLCTVSAHKIGGPKGIGALYVRRGTKLFTNAHGGGQERGLRSGTEAVFLAVGFAKAAELACSDLEAHERRMRGIWEHLRDRLTGQIPGVIVNSRADGSPYILNFTVPGMGNQAALEALSRQGIYVSKASACETNAHTVPKGTWRPKHPLSLQAAGIPRKLARNTLRVSFGHDTTCAEVDALVDALVVFLGC